MTGELNFKIVYNFHLIGDMGLVAILVASRVLEHGLFRFRYFGTDESVVGIDASTVETGTC